MTTTPKPSKREIVSAYHEAGHAVIAHAVGLPVKSVALTGLDGFGGNTRLDLDEVPVEEDTYLRQAIRTFVAGVMATSRMQALTGGRWPSSAAASVPDFIKARYFAEELGAYPREHEAGTTDVERMLEDPAIWGRVERVAAELLDRREVSAERFSEIVNALTPLEMERT